MSSSKTWKNRPLAGCSCLQLPLRCPGQMLLQRGILAHCENGLNESQAGCELKSSYKSALASHFFMTLGPSNERPLCDRTASNFVHNGYDRRAARSVDQPNIPSCYAPICMQVQAPKRPFHGLEGRRYTAECSSRLMLAAVASCSKHLHDQAWPGNHSCFSFGGLARSHTAAQSLHVVRPVHNHLNGGQPAVLLIALSALY